MHMGRFDEAEAVLLEALKKVTVTCPNFCFTFQIHFPLAPQKTMQHIHIKWCQKNGKIEVINWLLAIFIFVCIVYSFLNINSNFKTSQATVYLSCYSADTLLVRSFTLALYVQDAKDADTNANLVVCNLHLGKPATRYLR